MPLCKSCTAKSTLNVPGSCQNCRGLTLYFAHILCDVCSSKFDECQWCRAALKQASSALGVSPTGVFYTTCRDGDNGKTFKKLRRGEHIHVILAEDQNAWIEWYFKRPLSSNFRLVSHGGFVPDQSNPQFGSRQFIFDIVGTGLAAIEFEQRQRTWTWYANPSSTIGQAVPGGKTWQASFDVT